MRAALLAGAVVLLFSSGLPSTGEGHAIIMESYPKANEVVVNPPSHLVLRFNGRIVHSLSRVTLLGPDRVQVPVQSQEAGVKSPDPDRLVVRLPQLAPGAYIVQWRVLSVDGHVTRGTFSFRYSPGAVDHKQEKRR